MPKSSLKLPRQEFPGGSECQVPRLCTSTWPEGEWLEIGADKLGAGRLNVVILCHGNPSSGTSLLHRRDNLAFVVRDKAGVSKQVP